MKSFQRKLVSTVLVALCAGPLLGVSSAHAAGPANNQFASSEVLASSGSITRSNTGATAQAGEPAPITGDPFATIWFSWTAPTTKTVTFDTIGSDIDTVLSVYTGTSLAVLVEVASNDDGFGCDSTSALQFQAVAGTTYRIQIGTTDPSDQSDNLMLTWNWARGAEAANDNIAQATAETGTQTIHGTTNNSTPELGQNINENEGESSVWYKIPAALPTEVDLTLATSNTPNIFGFQPAVSGEVWYGTNPATASFSATIVADSAGAISAHIVTPGTIWIRIFSSSICEQGNFTLNMDARTGTVVTTSYAPNEFQLLSDISTRLGWTPEQLQHDAALIWQFIYAISGITVPTPVPTPAPGSVPVSSVWSASEINQLTLLNKQWVLPSTHTQRVAANVLMFIVGLGG